MTFGAYLAEQRERRTRAFLAALRSRERRRALYRLDATPAGHIRLGIENAPAPSKRPRA
ncbi:MAG: hypothetical protein ACRDK9_14000 [Solirubrobacterales bacterium]